MTQAPGYKKWPNHRVEEQAAGEVVRAEVNGELVAESRRFDAEEQVVLADIDLGRLAQDRMRMTSFNDAGREYREALLAWRRISFDPQLPG